MQRGYHGVGRSVSHVRLNDSDEVAPVIDASLVFAKARVMGQGWEAERLARG